MAERNDCIVVICVILTVIITRGPFYSYGVYVAAFEKEFHTHLTRQNWIYILTYVVSLSTMPISMMTMRVFKRNENRWGNFIGSCLFCLSFITSSFVPSDYWLFITFSLMSGISMSISYTASSRALVEYYDRDHKLHVMATSALMMGYPISSLTFNPVNAALVDKYGWRWALRINGILVFLVGTLCSWPLKSKRDPDNEDLKDVAKPANPSDGRGKPAIASFLRDCFSAQKIKERPEILFWYIGSSLNFIAFRVPFINLVYYQVLKGVPEMKASFLLTAMSATECVVYIVGSSVGDRFKGRLVYANLISSGFMAVLYFLWPLVDVNYAISLILAMCLGLSLGLSIVYSYAASHEVTELPIDVAWSCTNFWCGLGVLIAPFMTGGIFDIHQSYTDVFYTFGGVYVMMTISFLSIIIIKKRRGLKLNNEADIGLIDKHDQSIKNEYGALKNPDD